MATKPKARPRRADRSEDRSSNCLSTASLTTRLSPASPASSARAAWILPQVRIRLLFEHVFRVAGEHLRHRNDERAGGVLATVSLERLIGAVDLHAAELVFPQGPNPGDILDLRGRTDRAQR